MVFKILGQNPKMLKVFDNINKVSKSDSTVLITGESGTGKELVAKAIHLESKRKDYPFVAVNCGAIPSGLMESEFFGYDKGAFTGAYYNRIGKFEYANNGTIFFDEVDTLKPDFQVKLLRVIQERTFEKIGSNCKIHVNIRIIAATNNDLEKEIQRGNFRKDLYYRLNVIPIKIPSLRERKDDLILLINYFLKKYNELYNKNILGVTKSALYIMQKHNWPGNVRELENLVERLVIFGADKKQIGIKDLPTEIFSLSELLKEDINYQSYSNERNFLEKKYIIEALDKTNWKKIKAARELNMHRNTLLKKMKILGIQK